MPQILNGVQRQVAEWAFCAQEAHPDPFAGLELDVVITHANSQTWRVPAFWAGGRDWRVRFAPPLPGRYTWRSECSERGERGLHGQSGELCVEAYSGANALMRHGGLRVSANRRHFEHEDGTPFFWLGDTWWLGLVKRLAWPGDFQTLVADRVAKGFTVVQIVAGLYPDMDWHDARGANEAGFPYSQDFTQLNPAYFDAADLRIQCLVQAGLVPCIVGCWGYFLPWMGVEMKRHWRNLVARWGAYPVAWCLAGEATMPYYLSKSKDKDREAQGAGWSELGKYLRQIDPMRRPTTIHPPDCSNSRDQVRDEAVLDFDMLQTGHGGYDSIPATMRIVSAEVAREPAMPVIDGEVNYEGFMHGNYDEVQRIAFWGAVLLGAAGHTYGANGIWQVNTRAEPYGPSPHGATWGNRPWEDAMRLPGSAHLAIAKRLLLRFRWWEFQSHPEWIEPAAGKDNWWRSYAAGIPRQVRIFYVYQICVPWDTIPKVRQLEPDVCYHASYVNPETGEEHDLGLAVPDADGGWPLPPQPELRDWILMLTA